MHSVIELQTPTDSDVAQGVAHWATGWQVWNATHKDTGKLTAELGKKELDTELELAKEIIKAVFPDYAPSIRLTIVESARMSSEAPNRQAEIPELLQIAWLSALRAGETDTQTESLPDGSGVIRLCDDDFERLVAMLQEEREPTPALLRAGERYKHLVGW